MKNSLKKVSSEFYVLEKEDGKKFTITKSEEEKIIIYDEKLIESVIEKKFNQKYRKLLYIIMDINENDDSTESDTLLCLEKIEELKKLLINKYYKYITKDILNKYLKMIYLLEEKIKLKKHRGR